MDREGAPRVHLILIIVALLCVAAGTLFVITALRDTDPIGAKATILAAVHRHLGAGRQEPDVVDYGAIYRWTNAPSEVVIPRYMRWIIGFAVAGVVIGLGSVRWLRREVETKSLRLARANEELRQTEETLRLALEATKDGVWNAHLPTGEVHWNASAYTMLGYEPSEFPLTVKRWARLVHPDDREVAWSIAARQAYSGDGSVSAELRAQRRDGRWMWVHVRGKAIEWDSQGDVVRLTGTVSDITERKKAEAERERLLDHIQAQARQVQQIIDTVPDGVVLIDATGAVQLANPAAARLLPILTGQARPQSAGPAQPAPAVLGPITHLGDHALEQLLTPPPHGLRHEVHADSRVFDVIARPVTPHDAQPDCGSHCYVLVLHDATLERAVRDQLQQQERLAALGQLTAGIAHDFNNILAVVTLYTQMLAKSSSLSAEDRDRVGVINQQSLHAAHLIGQLLAFSRRSVIAHSPVRLGPFLREQVHILQRTLSESIRVELIATEISDFAVKADPTQLQQLAMNLALNARDAMPDGGVLRFTLDHVAIDPDQPPPMPGVTPGLWVRLRVSDTGTGIPAAIIPRLFEPFFTTKKSGKGNGLGLPQVHGIVTQHGGHIAVESQPGAGATFTVLLPALKSEPADATETAPDTLPRGHGERVLLVEDSMNVRAALRALLESWDYRVQEVADGSRALALIEEQAEPIALVLSDAVMPTMGGMALARTLRQRGHAAPVILLSGHPLDRDAAELAASGVTAWLTKPPDLDQLAHAIADALHPPA